MPDSNNRRHLPAEILDLIEQARQLKKWPVAKLISYVEIDTALGIKNRQNLMRYLNTDPNALSDNNNALVIGITGTPGAGKSSLINSITQNLLNKKPDFSIAVLAIDPSSQRTGGSILGDRTRMDFSEGGDRLFVRSQASDLDLGGLGRKTFHVTRLLKHFFDLVIIETVGIGQSEIEVEKLSDSSLLVLQPLAGDQVQFIKAGIMEIPDVFVVNKCDEESLARNSYQMLRSSLKMTAKHGDDGKLIERPIFMTSTLNNRGIDELADFISEKYKNKSDRKDILAIENHFLLKLIREAYGNFGLACFYENQASFKNTMSFEEKEIQFNELVKTRLIE